MVSRLLATAKRKNTFSLFASSSTEPPEVERKFLAAPFFKKGRSFFGHAEHGSAEPTASQSAFVLTHLSKLRKRYFGKVTNIW
ncbi:hypothetical protein CHL76_16555 [Marinococcus halophilus]|nr:hypothetical protein CHL76_16555 [Marinococcus halophilus]